MSSLEDYGYDDIEGGNLLGRLLGSLQDERLSVSEAVKALEADLRSQAGSVGLIRSFVGPVLYQLYPINYTSYS